MLCLPWFVWGTTPWAAGHWASLGGLGPELQPWHLQGIVVWARSMAKAAALFGLETSLPEE
jgi:hypothetical protein